MKKQFFSGMYFPFISVLSVLFFLQSCEPEQLFQPTTPEAKFINKSKAWFEDMDPKRDKSRVQSRTGEILWNWAKVVNGKDDIPAVMIPVRKKNKKNGVKRRLYIYDYDGQYYGYFMDNYPESALSEEETNEGYTNKTKVYNRYALLLETSYFGLETGRVLKKNKHFRRGLSTLKNFDEGCNPDDPDAHLCNDEVCVGDCNDNSNDCENACECYGIGCDDDENDCDDACECYGDCDDDCDDPCDKECSNYDICYCEDCDDDHDDNTGDITDDQVILSSDFIKTPAYCVYSELRRQDGDLFSKTIGSFIDDPKYDLKFVVGNCDYTDQACTDGKYTSDGKIIIKLENTNIKSFEAAALLLHEGIHAELFRYVDQVHNGEVDPNDKKRLLELYGIYKKLGWDDGSIPSQAQHVYMTENYVKPIARALMRLDMNDGNGQFYTLDYYMSYGWDGLSQYAHPSLINRQELDEYSRKAQQARNKTAFNPKNCN